MYVNIGGNVSGGGGRRDVPRVPVHAAAIRDVNAAYNSNANNSSGNKSHPIRTRKGACVCVKCLFVRHWGPAPYGARTSEKNYGTNHVRQEKGGVLGPPPRSP